jgi:hypothetical protein
MDSDIVKSDFRVDSKVVTVPKPTDIKTNSQTSTDMKHADDFKK